MGFVSVCALLFKYLPFVDGIFFVYRLVSAMGPAVGVNNVVCRKGNVAWERVRADKPKRKDSFVYSKDSVRIKIVDSNCRYCSTR